MQCKVVWSRPLRHRPVLGIRDRVVYLLRYCALGRGGRNQRAVFIRGGGQAETCPTRLGHVVLGLGFVVVKGWSPERLPCRRATLIWRRLQVTRPADPAKELLKGAFETCRTVTLRYFTAASQYRPWIASHGSDGSIEILARH